MKTVYLIGQSGSGKSHITRRLDSMNIPGMSVMDVDAELTKLTKPTHCTQGQKWGAEESHRLDHLLLQILFRVSQDIYRFAGSDVLIVDVGCGFLKPLRTILEQSENLIYFKRSPEIAFEFKREQAKKHNNDAYEKMSLDDFKKHDECDVRRSLYRKAKQVDCDTLDEDGVVQFVIDQI